MTATITPVLAAADLARLTSVLALIGSNDTESVIASAMPSLREDERAALTRHTTFAHAALLVFPERHDGLPEELARHGIKVRVITPAWSSGTG
jgi:hypothetical protein